MGTAQDQEGLRRPWPVGKQDLERVEDEPDRMLVAPDANGRLEVQFAGSSPHPTGTSFRRRGQQGCPRLGKSSNMWLR